MNLHGRKGRWIPLAVLLVAMIAPIGCSTVPVTGRSQLHLVPASTMLSMGNQQYDQFLNTHQKSRDTQKTAMVRRVGTRIADGVEDYFRQKGMAGQLKGYNWEFSLVESKEQNAWCMPGGKVVVYTGILPITQNETGLAVVMAHEIAHAAADHGSERMSQALLAQLGGMALSQALSQKPQKTRQLWMTAFGVGAQYGALLPFSRLQESEADRLGLIFMAMAGYDPGQAVSFWERMAARVGSGVPTFMSTHPSNPTRIARIKAALPEAMQYYRKGGKLASR